MDKLASIKAFCAVVRDGSFSAAARSLGVSTAMVSKHIKRLEDELGARLLNRSTRHNALTEAGDEYFRRCQQLLAQLEELEFNVRTLSDEVRGTLKISAPATFGTLFLMPAILQYKQRHPHVQINLRLSPQMPDILEGGFDLAIYAGNAKLDNSSLLARRLGSFRLAVCASKTYLDEHGTPTHPQELVRHNCLIYHDEVAHDEWIFKGAGTEIAVHVQGDLHANQGNALRVAAVGGLGIVRLPNYLLQDDVRARRLKEILSEYRSPPRAVYALHHQRRHVPAKVRTFIDFLAERFEADHDIAEAV
ncbi:MAG: LysR family transcriptional regulator [Gammaproteobacteria bacterium]|nr:LysR family transcriptional regulator [Gammaproteobacteria bacterium]